MKEAVGKEELWQQAGGRRRVRAATSLGFYHLLPAELHTHQADGGSEAQHRLCLDRGAPPGEGGTFPLRLC